MASYTANYNLRKDASTEKYDVAVVNQNLDDIDAQMHQNEVASTTPFTGASSSTNGEKGIVPRPMAGDEENFLCGDGTWKPVQGGSASTSELSLEDYQALTDAQKKNGTIYFVGASVETEQLIPRVSGSTTNITSSSSYSGYDDWKAFNGINSSDLRNPDNIWCPNTDETNSYIQYHFDQAYYLSQFKMNCFSNYHGDWIGDIKIEGSNDNLTWTNLLTSGNTLEITAKLAPTSEGGTGSETEILIPLDTTNSWEYVRLTGIDAMMVWGGASCMVDEIYVYGSAYPIVIEDFDIYFMGNKYTNNVTIADMDFTQLSASQIADLKTALGIS